MREMIRGVVALAAVAGLALAASGQDVVDRGGAGTAGTVTRPERLPYTAEFKITRVQTLADGTTVTHESTEVMARDSQGRNYQSTTNSEGADDPQPRVLVNINDPVAKTHTFWAEPGQRVTVSSFTDGSLNGCKSTSPALRSRGAEQNVKPVKEELGKQTIEGLEAHGTRTTRTYPTGSVGNSAPLVHSDEWWVSTNPGLSGITLRQVTEDPRTGKMTRELVKFTPGEPDATSFQPPEGFATVTQETRNEVRCP